MWKILCLHGQGTSADVLERQLLPLSCRLGEHFDLVYLEGKIECSAPPGLGDAIPPPYLCYFAGFEPSEVKAAHKLLDKAFEEQGPFEGIIAFSQGASLVLSYLMQREICKPLTRPAFGWAMLVAPFTAIAPTCELYDDMLKDISTADMTSFMQLFKGDEGKPSTEEIAINPKLRVLELAASFLRAGVDYGFLREETVKEIIDRADIEKLPRIFDGRLLKQRLHVPIVQVVGRRDPLKPQAELTKNLCYPEHMRYIEHSQGHIVPTLPEIVDEMRRAVDWAIEHRRYIAW